MNEEREDTELAELLKQLPAPTRLDDARRNAIFTALPQGRAPRKTSYSWSRFLRFAALLVLVGGVLGGLLFPAGPLALEHARKVKTAHVSSMSLREEKADYSYGVEMDALVDEPSTAPPVVTAPAAATPAKPAAYVVSGALNEHPREKKRVVDGRMDVDGFAKALAERGPDLDLKEAEEPAPVTPRPAEIQSVAIVKSPIVMRGIEHGAKPVRSASLARERRNAPQVQQPQSAQLVELPRQEAQEKVEAQLQAASDGSPMVAQELAQAVDSDEDVYYTEGTTFKAKRKGSGERLRSEQRASEVAAQVGFDAPEESLPSVGDTRDSAADPFGGSLSAGKAEVADSEARAEDWEGFFSELGVEWPKNPDGSPVTLGVGLREAEAKPQSAAVTEPEAVAEYQGRAATHRQERDGLQHDSISELATLERSRRKLFDDHARNMLAEGQAALRDRKPAVALEKFAAAKKFLVANEENREAIEQVHAGMREAYDFLPRGAGAAVSDTLPQSELSTMPPADKASGEPEDDLVKRMKEIVIPEIDFRKANVSDIVTFLSESSREFGTASEPAEQREVNIVLHPSVSGQTLPLLSMNTRYVTLKGALDVVAELANLKYKIQGNTIILSAQNTADGAFTMRRFNVAPTFLPDASKEDADASEAAKAFFKKMGVEWPEGSSCRYNPETQSLQVINTQENLEALEMAVATLNVEKKPPAPVDFGPFTLIPTAEHPLSTFGLDVDSAGYSRAVSMIDEGSRPEASAIRQEEFINAFDYGDLAPAEATFRVYLEGAASPFRPGNHLLRVGVKGRRLGREEQRPLRLTILLDASGSMETPERMALAKRAIEALLATLSPGDTVTLLTCSDKTRRIFSRSGWGTDEAAREAETALGGIRCQGATNLEDGIVRAFESASADFAPEAENRVVILSDGIANLGSANAEEILAKVAANRDRGISCSVIGVGRSTYNDALLEAMANRGNGQYRFLDSEASIHESFVEDLQNSFNTIAADVKIQVEWNLSAVKAYRSHGYDSRALKDEQFRDDSVDAGEVGSGQGVTVVYEMQLAEGLKPGATLGTVRIRYRRIDTGAVEEIEAPIAAEAVQRDFVRARSQFRLASAVAEFATVLKHVPPAAQANALQPVAAEAVRVAVELDFYTPAKSFAETVKRLMGIGL